MTFRLPRRSAARSIVGALIISLTAIVTAGGSIKLSLPGGSAYQTDESINISLSPDHAGDSLPTSSLTIAIAGEDGSRVTATFAPPEYAVNPSTCSIRLNAALLRPGQYSLDLTWGTAKATIPLAVFSHIRRSTYLTLDTSEDADRPDLTRLGENCIGFNLLMLDGKRVGRESIAKGGLAVRDWAIPAAVGSTPRSHEPARESDGSAADGFGGFNHTPFELTLRRARQHGHPNWLLPSADSPDGAFYTLERNLAFAAGAQGIATPSRVALPATDLDITASQSLGAVVAFNKLAARLGPAIASMPPAEPIVTLVTPNQAIEAADDRLRMLHLAGRLNHYSVGLSTERTLAVAGLSRQTQAAILPGGFRPTETTLTVLRQFADAGGVVLAADDIDALPASFQKIGAAIDTSPFDVVRTLAKEGKQKEAALQRSAGVFLLAAKQLAAALRTRLDVHAIRPDFDCDVPGVYTSRLSEGDVEYLFATNGEIDDAARPITGKSTLATLSLAGDPRPTYDVIHGGIATPFKPTGGRVRAAYRFGPGQMRIWARLPRAIAGVAVATPLVELRPESEREPIKVALSAVVLDRENRLISGPIPLRIRLTDPLGSLRYDLWRATQRGVLQIDLPLAANDPAGQWTVAVRDMLSGSEGLAKFDFRPPTQLGAIAGRVSQPGAQALLDRPVKTQIVAATKATLTQEAAIAWRLSAVDRVISLQVADDKLVVFSNDGTVMRVGLGGRVLSQELTPVVASPRPVEKLSPALAARIADAPLIKRVTTSAGVTAVGYWGGEVQMFAADATLKSDQFLPGDIGDMIWFDGKLIVGQSDGALVALLPPVEKQ